MDRNNSKTKASTWPPQTQTEPKRTSRKITLCCEVPVDEAVIVWAADDAGTGASSTFHVPLAATITSVVPSSLPSVTAEADTVTFVPGCMCATAWILGNFCGTVGAALERQANGGDAVTMTQMMAVQLVVSGLWGIFFYREIRGRQALVWSACALWTLVSMALLGLEKAN